MQGDLPDGFAAASPSFIQGGETLFMLPEFNEGGIGIMLTYGEIIATVAVLISIVRLVLDIVKYLDETKKK